MRTALISLYRSYPATFGAASVSYNLAKFMPGERYLLQLSDGEGEEEVVDDLTIINFRASQSSRAAKLLSLARLLPRIARRTRDLHPDAVVLEGASWTVYYVALLRLMRWAGLRTPVVYHGHNVEYLLRREKSGRLVTGLTRWAERALLRSCDAAYAVSDIDAGRFCALYGIRPVVLPNGVDAERFAVVTAEEATRARTRYGLTYPTALFMGGYPYLPNREAIDALVQDIVPRVRRSGVPLSLAVIGGEVPYTRSWLRNPGVILDPELPAFLKACDVCVAPIFSGSGTRLKVLEYLAAGKPVVATPKAVEGLCLAGAGSVTLAENRARFARCLAQVAKRESEVGVPGCEYRAPGLARYGWRGLAAAFGDDIARVTGKANVESSVLREAAK